MSSPQKNPSSEAGAEADAPLMTYGLVEDLDVYEQYKDEYKVESTEAVDCSICGLYSGTPETIKQHEATHEANGDRSVFDNFAEVYARTSEKLRKKREREGEIKAEEKRSNKWRLRIIQLLEEENKTHICPVHFEKLTISVRVGGVPLDVDEFEKRLTSNVPAKPEPSA